MTEVSRPFGLLLSVLLAFAVVAGTVRGVQGTSRLNPVAVVLLGGGLSWLLGAIPALIVYQQDGLSLLDLTRSSLPRLAVIRPWAMEISFFRGCGGTWARSKASPVYSCAGFLRASYLPS